MAQGRARLRMVLRGVLVSAVLVGADWSAAQGQVQLRGEWSPREAYRAGDRVTLAGTTFEALRAHRNLSPETRRGAQAWRRVLTSHWGPQGGIAAALR